MRRLWIANDIYAELSSEKKHGISISMLLRELLGLPHKKYNSCPKTKSEAVCKGIAKAKRKGVHVGRPRFPAHVRAEAQIMSHHGKTLGEIAVWTGMSRSTVKRVLGEKE